MGFKTPLFDRFYFKERRIDLGDGTFFSPLKKRIFQARYGKALKFVATV